MGEERHTHGLDFSTTLYSSYLRMCNCLGSVCITQMYFDCAWVRWWSFDRGGHNTPAIALHFTYYPPRLSYQSLPVYMEGPLVLIRCSLSGVVNDSAYSSCLPIAFKAEGGQRDFPVMGSLIQVTLQAPQVPHIPGKRPSLSANTSTSFATPTRYPETCL